MATVANVVTPWHVRAWYRVRSAFRTEVRARTAAEQALADEAAALRQAVKDRDAALARAADEARALRQDIAERDAELAVRRREVELLAGVVARDRARVQAEAAVYAGQAAQAVAPRRG